MEEIKKNLNDKQQEAATHKDGPLLIIAGAGAGKTKTLTERIMNLIRQGVGGENILALTFTNKAAGEMRERVLGLLSRELYGEFGKPWLGTFHSLGVKMLRENAAEIGLNKNFTILDESESIRIVRDAIKDMGLDPKQYEPRRFKNII